MTSDKRVKYICTNCGFDARLGPLAPRVVECPFCEQVTLRAPDMMKPKKEKP